jgi:putative DNA methylase
MGSLKADDARLKRAVDFKKADFDGDFGKSPMRAVLFALFELQREVEIDEVMAHLRDLVPGYMTRREDLMAICQYLAARREVGAPDEAQAARVLFARIKNERLGG